MTETKTDLPTDPKRVRAFANFFKRYMSISTIVVAALPIPVTYWHLIPTPPEFTGILSVITPLFCFLTLSYLFYIRHTLAKHMFPYDLASKSARKRLSQINRMPMALIISCLFSFIAYIYLGVGFGFFNEDTERVYNEYSIYLLMICVGQYVLFFVFAESAFVLMALKEYIQDLLGKSDIDLIGGIEKSQE